MLLARFDSNGAVEVVTRIELQTLLIGINIQLNTCGVGVHCQDADICGLGCGVPGTVKNEGVVVAGAIESAIVDCVENVSSDLFWRGEIEGRAVDDADRAVWYFDVVDLNVARRVGHVECVV